MKLEPPHAKLAHKAADLARARLALVRIDTGEGDQDIVIFGTDFRDFLVGIAAKSRLPLRIDGKDHGDDVAYAVIGGGVLHSGQHPFGPSRIAETGRHA